MHRPRLGFLGFVAGIALAAVIGERDERRILQSHKIGSHRSTVLHYRPSHPGKPRSYYQRQNVPKGQRA